MLTKADEEQLQRVCGNEEILTFARKLVPLAKARTKHGSGHNISDLATGLPAICAYIASKHLNNDDVTFDNARQAACLNTKAFDKALRTLSAVLNSELESKKGKHDISYASLHEIYGVELPYTNLVIFLRQAEHALVQLETLTRHKVESPEVRCGIFFWACTTIKVKDFPTLDEFAQDHKVLSKRLAPTIKLLSEKCNSLTTKLMQTAKNPSSPSSPSKSLQSTTPRTPRRSPTKPPRELPTRESVKKQRQAHAAEQSSPNIDLSTGTASPETPTKKRKFDTSPDSSPSKKRPRFPPATPSAVHISQLTSPTKRKINPTPAIPSPLRRSTRYMLQQEVDAEMEQDEEEVVLDQVNRSLEIDLAQVLKEGEEECGITCRFRPAYQDYKQWFTRDARVLRIWKDARQGHENGVEA